MALQYRLNDIKLSNKKEKEKKMNIEQEFIKRLNLLDFTIKSNVCGASTIFKKKEIGLETWYSGFWGNKQNEETEYFGISLVDALNKLVGKAIELCPNKVIAISDCGIDKTYHKDFEDTYYNVYVTFGGY